MKLTRWRRQRQPRVADEIDTRDERQAPQIPAKDVLAIIIALFQLVLPLIVALVVVAAVVMLILR